MVVKVASSGSRTPGAPADKIAALIERYKLVLIGLATIGVIVVSAQLLLTERHGFLDLQLGAAILLWIALVFSQQLSTRFLVVSAYLTVISFVVAGAANIGLAEPSMFILVALVVTSTVIWGMRAGLLTLALILAVLAGLASRFLAFPADTFDLSYFLVSPTRWALFLLAIGISGVWCILIVDLQRRYWLSALQELREEGDRRRENEIRLRHSEQDLRQIVEGSIQGILVIGMSRKPIFVNEELVRIFGYDSREELLALDSTAALIAPEEIERLDKIREPFLSAPRTPIRYEFDGIKKNRARITLEIVAGSIMWRGELAVQATMYDITDKARYEDLVRKSQRMEAIGRLSGGIAHDFNNLLAAIQGNAELLELAPDDAPDHIAEILKATARGADLTQRLLIYASQQEMSPTAVNLGVAINDMTEMLKRTLGAEIQIEEMIQSDLWFVATDANQFKDALLNLAINARDAMPRGGSLQIVCENISLDETLAAQNPDARVGDYVSVIVADTGDGIGEGDMVRVFEPFFTTKGVGKGTGLGLSMVYGFVKQSGGHVTLKSRKGRGTSVAMFLPRTETEDQAARAGSSPDRPVGQGQTVLVIEDDPTVQKMTLQMLEGLGYLTLRASDIDEARGVLAANRSVDLVLSDVVLPGGTNGLEFSAEARARYPHTAFILMSGFPAGTVTRGALEASGLKYLRKPFGRHELAKALRDGLAARFPAPDVTRTD